MGAFRPPSTELPFVPVPFSTRRLEADFLRPGVMWPFVDGDVTVLLFFGRLSSSMSSERLSVKEEIDRNTVSQVTVTQFMLSF